MTEKREGIWFGPLKDGNGNPVGVPLECVMVDDCHVGYWGTVEGNCLTLFRDLSESEEEKLLEACMEARGWIPPQVIRQAWGKLVRKGE